MGDFSAWSLVKRSTTALVHQVGRYTVNADNCFQWWELLSFTISLFEDQVLFESKQFLWELSALATKCGFTLWTHSNLAKLLNTSSLSSGQHANELESNYSPPSWWKMIFGRKLQRLRTIHLKRSTTDVLWVGWILLMYGNNGSTAISSNVRFNPGTTCVHGGITNRGIWLSLQLMLENGKNSFTVLRDLPDCSTHFYC